MEVAIHERPRHEYAPLIDELHSYLVSEGMVAQDALAPPAPISWAEVGRLARTDQIRFESRGASHTAVCAHSDAELDRGLLHRRERISEHTGRDCRHSCCPCGNPGSIGARAAARVRDAYDSGVTMTRGRLRKGPLSLLSRIPFYAVDDANVVRLKLLTA